MFLAALAVIGLVDAIAYMAVGPSLIFYVLECGGTKEQYGLILSAFSFASFLGKPILGYWTDATGNKYRVPYFVSIFIDCMGGIVYYTASFYATSNSKLAIALILCGRLMGGFGAANSALGFAYLAEVVPANKLTQTNSLLSMTRIVGMAAGPGVNVILSKINGELTIGGLTMTFTPLNTVGLFLFVLNFIGFVMVYFLLEEPPEKSSKAHVVVTKHDSLLDDIWAVVKAVCTVDILLPIYTIFVINSNFQLVETAFPPAVSDALGWGPVQTSAVLGSASILIFGCMLIVFYLSKKNVSDEVLVGIGSIAWVVGGTLIYFSWVVGAPSWHFFGSIYLAICGFPFIAASNRSMFTVAVDREPLLETKHGTMQAVLSMAASAAGFLTPGLVAAFVLKHPDEVAVSNHGRELTIWALYAPILSAGSLLGIMYLLARNKLIGEPAPVTTDRNVVGGDGVATEITSLLDERRKSAIILQQKLDPNTEQHRRQSSVIMGISMGDNPREEVWSASVSDQLADLGIDDSEFN